MGVKLVASSNGSVELVPANTASNFTVTVPAATGTMLTTASTAVVTQAMLSTNVAGNGPAFRATRSGAFTVTANTWTKFPFNTESFDTNNCYDNSTNYRFTPTIAGYYQINVTVNANGAPSQLYVSIYLNGASNSLNACGGSSGGISGVSNGTVMYLNGTTDYIEAYCYFTSTLGTNGGDYSGFSAALVRAA